jgi:hypothetical protein
MNSFQTLLNIIIVNNSGRIIKDTAITSKKPNKRKGAKSNISNKPAKVAKLQ